MEKLNSENPIRGRQFQEFTQELMASRFEIPFDLEIGFPIGDPPKDHRFDCVSKDRKIVVECKCYTWTSGQNNPSAKMATLNEVVLYMSFLPPGTKRIIAIKKATDPSKSETLAEYYCRINGHLLKGIEVDEISEDGFFRILHTSDAACSFEKKDNI